MPPKRRASAAGNSSHEHLAKVLTSPELNSIKNQKIQQKLEAALSKGKAASAAATTTAAGGELGDDQLKVKIQKLEAELDARNHEFEKKQVY